MSKPITSAELIERTGGADEPFQVTQEERAIWHEALTTYKRTETHLPTQEFCSDPPAELKSTRAVPDLVYDAPTHRDMAMEILAKMPVLERYQVIADAQERARQLEQNDQFEKKPLTIKEAIELEQAMAKGLQTGHCRIVGIEYTPWIGVVRRVRVWDLRDSMWHGVEWRGRLRKHMPIIHPWQYDVRADMLAQGWKVIIGTAPEVSSWGIGLQFTSADHALHELGRFGWFVWRLPAFLRAMERGNQSAKPKSWWPGWRWVLASWSASAAVVALAWWLLS